MENLSGRRLTALALALIAACAAGAIRVLAAGDLAPAEARAASAGAVPPRTDEIVAQARAAERRGDVAAALSRYRAAVSMNPRLADRRAPEYLGADFEKSLARWIAGMRQGRIAADGASKENASYLFRRLYGGCG